MDTLLIASLKACSELWSKQLSAIIPLEVNNLEILPEFFREEEMGGGEISI